MRLNIIRVIYFLAMGLIVLRLGYWQIVQADNLSAKAENQRLFSKETSGERGTIFYSDGSVLVSTQPVFLVFAQPKLIPIEERKNFSKKVTEIFLEEENEEENNDQKAKLLKEVESDILNNISQNLYWVGSGKKVGIDDKKKLERLNMKGLGFEQTSIRFYPESSSSAHLLGFVGSDIYGGETGYFGVEGYYNGELKGKKGVITEEKDALGLPILIGSFTSQESQKGKNIKLNIDRSIQHIVEEKLKKGLEKYGAKEGSVIIMEPETGNVLALASIPGYDPAKPYEREKNNFQNPVIADGYEPGSTLKVLVMSAAINENLVKPDTTCDDCSGPVTIGEYNIKTWNNKYQPNLTMMDTIVHSDNTGMVFTGRKLGPEKLYTYLDRFGFGRITGVDLQDEQSPKLAAAKNWREIDLAAISFGQGISVTAMQIVRAVASIASGGKLMEPHVVSEIQDGGKIFKIKSKIVGQPISEGTAKTMKEMMVRAVEEGEAKSTSLKGFKIAGKTGTAQIPVAGHYDPNKTIASFVGFAPADHPKFVILVKYIEPSSSIFGAETAAPTFFEIAKELFIYYGIAPNE